MTSAQQTYYKASPSKLGVWLDCRRRFRLQYIDRVKSTDVWAHFSFGNSVHAALKKWWDVPVEQRTLEVAEQLVERNWDPRGYQNETQSMAWAERGKAMVREYLADVDPEHEPLTRETNYSLLTEHLNLTGRVDRLDERNGELVVIDYKTGKSVSTEDEARSSQAMALYAAAAQYRHKQPCLEVELHHVPSNNVAAWRHTPESIQRQLDRMDSLGVEAMGAEADAKSSPDSIDDIFLSQPGPLCSYCPYLSGCPEGSANFVKRDPWSGLAELQV